MSEIGTKIREYRKEKGWSQTYLAQKCGIARTDLCAIEIGVRPCGAKRAMRIAKALGIGLSNLYVVEMPAVAPQKKARKAMA